MAIEYREVYRGLPNERLTKRYEGTMVEEAVAPLPGIEGMLVTYTNPIGRERVVRLPEGGFGRLGRPNDDSIGNNRGIPVDLNLGPAMLGEFF